MTDIPKQIQIGPLAYSVAVDQKAIDKERKDSRDVGCLGVISRHMQTITLAEDQGQDSLKANLLHEVLHAIVGLTDLYEHKMDDEQTITTFSMYLLDIMRRNPQLIAYLMEQ